MKKVVLALGMTLAMATVALGANSKLDVDPQGAYPGSRLYNEASYTTLPTDDATFDNGIGNANKTGEGVGGQTEDTSVIKSKDMVKNDGSGGVGTNQRTHGEYQNNTNSCASCHQTHTAAAKSLLFKDGVFTTCTACHDGTLGFYNVFEKSTAGTFGGTQAGNSSVHMVEGGQYIKAAPGGNINNTNGSDPNATNPNDGMWGAEFNCASCHSPHGSYSDRLLQYNPNNQANVDRYLKGDTTAGDTVDAQGYKLVNGVRTASGGQKIVGMSVYTKTASEGQFIEVAQPKAAPTDPQTYKYYAITGVTQVPATPPATGNVSIGTVGAEITAADADYARITTDYLLVKGLATDWTITNQQGQPESGTVAVMAKRSGATDPANSNKTITAKVDNPADLTGPQITVTVQTFKRDKTPWLYGYAFNPYPKKDYYSTLFKADGTDSDTLPDVIDKATDVEYEYGLAYVKEVAAGVIDTAITGNVAPVYITKLFGIAPADTTKGIPARDYSITSAASFVADFGGVPITKVSADIYDESTFGVGIGKFCAACHTDYRVSSGSESGVWSKAFRHTTNNDRYTCLKCHFAHGTDVTVMLDAQDNDLTTLTAKFGGDAAAAAKAEEYLLDKNPSSALKRYTNMAVCWKCHTDSKASQLKNNAYYWSNADAPHGGASGLQTAPPAQYNW